MGFGDDKKNMKNMDFMACFREGEGILLSIKYSNYFLFIRTIPAAETLSD